MEFGTLNNQAYPASTSVLLYDLVYRRPAPLPASIKNAVGYNFAFIGPDKIVAVNAAAPQKSPVLKFPTGEKLQEAHLADNIDFRAATHGNLLLLGPLKGYPLGILDLSSNQINVVIKQKTADVYDGVLLIERGELALHAKDTGNFIAVARIPESGLGALKATAVSPDLNYLAVSTRTRGAVWDVGHDVRIFYTRPFTGAGLDSADLYADFPKFEDKPRQLVRLQFDQSPPEIKEIAETFAIQNGIYLTEIKPRNKSGLSWSNADLQVEDVRSGLVLWSRYFNKDLPAVSFNPQAATALLWWRMSEPGAQDEQRHLGDLKTHFDKDDYLFEVADTNGFLIAYFIVKTNGGSLRFLSASANRNWAVMQAAGDQTLTYTLPTGEEKGHFFGSRPVISSSGLLALDSAKREITLYDMGTSEEVQHASFAAPVSFKAFSADGKHLIIFTNDQTVYLFDVTRKSPSESVETKKSAQ
jgi:WD40 repeat protein